MTFYITPSRRMISLHQAMDRLVDESIHRAYLPERELMLSVDVQAGDDAYDIRALVPGLDVEKLNIEVLDDTVTIRGEFQAPSDENSRFLISELPSGKFSRVVTLPTTLDPAKAEANIKDGVLTLRVPKAESHRPRSIKVSTN